MQATSITIHEIHGPDLSTGGWGNEWLTSQLPGALPSSFNSTDAARSHEATFIIKILSIAELSGLPLTSQAVPPHGFTEKH